MAASMELLLHPFLDIYSLLSSFPHLKFLGLLAVTTIKNVVRSRGQSARHLLHRRVTYHTSASG